MAGLRGRGIGLEPAGQKTLPGAEAECLRSRRCRTIISVRTAQQARSLTVEDSETQPLMPQLRLDDLLAELQGRLQAVLNTRDRTHALLEAVVAIGGYL